MRAGFSGGLVVDFPHSTRAKKYFLVLMVGSAGSLPPPKGLDGGSDSGVDEVKVAGRQRATSKRHKAGHPGVVSYKLIGFFILAWTCFGAQPFRCLFCHDICFFTWVSKLNMHAFMRLCPSDRAS